MMVGVAWHEVTEVWFFSTDMSIARGAGAQGDLHDHCK